MKSVFVVACVFLLSASLAPAVLAKEMQQYRAEADRYYQEGEFKKAYKNYFKMAKSGDHYGQRQVSLMAARGLGRTADLTEAYAWSVLAAESGESDVLRHSNDLLQRIDDKAEAKKQAEKLKQKYGQLALMQKANRKARQREARRTGACTGSRLSC